MVNGLVNHQKAVVGIFKNLNINGFVLRVVKINVVLQGWSYLTGINCGFYPRRTLVKKFQNRIIYIIVNENDPFLCAANQVADKDMGIKHLTFKKDAFNWRELGANKKVYLFGMLSQQSLLVFQLVLDFEQTLV